jgi:acylphosphatase
VVADQGAHFLISGIVQGVGFRYWTERVARELEVTGWVRNLVDGRVEVFAEGSAEKLRMLEASLWRGPRSAEVLAVEVRSVPLEGRASFDIRRDGEEPAWP